MGPRWLGSSESAATFRHTWQANRRGELELQDGGETCGPPVGINGSRNRQTRSADTVVVQSELDWS